MKALLIVLSICFCSINNYSQTPVSWKIEQSQLKSSVIFTATIDSSWHLYAVNVPNPDQGPLPTEFNFSKSDNYTLIGEVQEENPISVFDYNFGVQVSYFEKKARFEQAIKLLSENVELTVDIAYMVCNESMCIPFNDSFQINLKN